MYIAVEGIDGWMAEYGNAKQAYIDNTNSGTSLLIIKLDKEDTAYYNMDQIRGFFTSKKSQ